MEKKLKSVAMQQDSAFSTKPHFVLELLRYEFTKRVQKNPRYSQRSFAKYIGVSHTLLSLILNGHREPSSALLEKLSERLNYSPEKAALLRATLEARKRKSTLESSNPSKNQKVPVIPDQLSLDQFAMISEWQHYAILSLLEVKDTEFTPKFISQRLGISETLAKVSMQRLISMDIVGKDATGKWRQRNGPIIVNNTRSTESTRKFQRQLMGKAVESLLNDPIEIRDLSSTTFAMHPKHTAFALQRIREFRRQLTQELEAFGDPEEVYNLSVQLFPTSHRRKK
jgi:uncharacterized protein (TIGR02147 family)